MSLQSAGSVIPEIFPETVNLRNEGNLACLAPEVVPSSKFPDYEIHLQEVHLTRLRLPRGRVQGSRRAGALLRNEIRSVCGACLLLGRELPSGGERFITWTTQFRLGGFWGLRWQVIGPLSDRQQWGGVPQKKGGNRKLRLAASGYLLG